MNKHTWKIYGLWILLSEAVGALSGWLTRDGVKIYSQSIVQPPLSPPPLVFPIVWAILFALMGIGAARVFLGPASAARTRGLRLFFVQLGFNFLWSILFFCLQAFGFSLIRSPCLATHIRIIFQPDSPSCLPFGLPYIPRTEKSGNGMP